MEPGSLLPYITGSSGALVVLVIGIVCYQRELIVTGRQHRRDLKRDAATIERLEGVVATMSTANETLRQTNLHQAAQIDRLLDGSNLSNTLAQALVSVAQQPSPRRSQRRPREADKGSGLAQETTDHA